MTTYSILDKFAGLASGSGPYTPKVQGIQTADQIGYWRMNEAAGAYAFDLSPQINDGDYTAVTLGQEGIGDGETCPLFDGATSYLSIPSAGYGADWNGNEFTIAGWLKVSGVEVWTDGSQNNAITLAADADNLLYLCKSVGDNVFGFRFKSGGVEKTSHVVTVNPTDWFHVAMTMSLTDDARITYWNGLKYGPTLTGVGEWVGVPGDAIIGAANDTPLSVWDGWMAHWLIWKRVLNAAEVLQLATL